jgi:predicted Co/Zn/Cd cation transporter (cation efflux family)
VQERIIPLRLNSEKHVSHDNLYKLAIWLALFTIFYNIIEGLISTFLGFEDESLALFGFGTDSFIEVISGIGIAHMVFRIQNNHESKRDAFEGNALKITGFSFYILVLGLLSSSLINILEGHRPVTTFWGIIISSLSILVMGLLVAGKRNIGKKLNSRPILADSNCTMVCIYMSLILLISSGIYELTHIPYIDSIGTLGLTWFAFKEGRECFAKAAVPEDISCDCC